MAVVVFWERRRRTSPLRPQSFGESSPGLDGRKSLLLLSERPHEGPVMSSLRNLRRKMKNRGTVEVDGEGTSSELERDTNAEGPITPLVSVAGFRLYGGVS